MNTMKVREVPQVIQGSSRLPFQSNYLTARCYSSPSSSEGSRPARRTATRRNRLTFQPGSDLVGPPDAQSNLRQAVYGSAFEQSFNTSKSKSTSNSHPYSTSEFTSSFDPSPTRRQNPHSKYYESLLQRLEISELNHHLRRARSDRFSQQFWADNNYRYNRDMANYSNDSNSSSPKGKEDLLAPFNAAWLDANSKRHQAYNYQLWSMAKEDLGPALQYSLLKKWVTMVRWVEVKLGKGD
ncbi:unnamed protein product [Sympodiomycopsis kandeliae]